MMGNRIKTGSSRPRTQLRGCVLATLLLFVGTGAGDLSLAAEASRAASSAGQTRSLTIEAYPAFPYTARISWTLAENNRSPILVGRADQPIESADDVINALNLTSPPLRADTREFIDQNIPDGSHYYVVVTLEELHQRGHLQLQDGKNTSARPFQIARPGSATPSQEEKKVVAPRPENPLLWQVHALVAIDSTDGVVLNWRPALGSPIRYQVWRSSRPFHNEESFRQARQLAVIDEGQLWYIDRDPRPFEEQFYAVTVIDQSSGRHYSEGRFNESYIAHIYRPRLTRVETDQAGAPPLERRLPRALRAEAEGEQQSRITWQSPEEPVTRLRLFRSRWPIDSEAALRLAERVSDLPGDENFFRERELPPGLYYYALLPVVDGETLGEFIAGESFTTIAVAIDLNLQRDRLAAADPAELQRERERERQSITAAGVTVGSGGSSAAQGQSGRESSDQLPLPWFFQAEARGEESVELFWDLPRNERSQLRYLLFRSDAPLRNRHELERHGALIQVLPGDTLNYRDTPPGPGAFYYALLVQSGEDRTNLLLEGRHFLRHPIALGVDDEPSSEANGLAGTTGESTDFAKQESESVLSPEAEVEAERKEQEERLAREQERARAVERARISEFHRDLRQSYFRQEYPTALRLLAPYGEDAALPAEVRARAQLYLALSHYHLGAYREALRLLRSPLVINYEAERSDFWQRRILEVQSERRGGLRWTR